MSKRLVTMLAVMLAAEIAPAQEVRFTTPPESVRLAEATVIRFAVSGPTDVAVWIEDAAGKTVRHLAAGALGPGRQSAGLLKADSLEQSIPWDGNDDLGKPVAGGPFKAKVALGLRPRLDKVIGNNPADLGGVRSLAVGPDGRLYVFHCYGGHHANDSSAACAVFDRQGNYLRTILPFPADLPDAKLAGIRRLDAAGRKAPFVYQLETRSYLPGLGDLPNQRSVVTRDGRLAFVGVQEGPRPFAQPGLARLTVVHTDGSVPADGVLKTPICPLTETGASLALSPDEKTIYAAGVRVGTHLNGPGQDFVCDICDHGGDVSRHTLPLPYVYRFGWNDPQPILFVGGQPNPAHEENKLVEPVSVATDGEGNIYVADVGADQIVVFATDERGNGKLLKRIKIDKPQRVEVHKKTGAIYVLAGAKDVVLVKLDGYQNAREVARLAVNRYERGFPPSRRPLLALDDQADPPILWIGQPFWRVEDKGDSFGQPLDLRDPARVGERAMAAVMEMSLDRVHGWLYVNNGRRMSLATGQWESIQTEGGRMWPSSTPGSANGNAGRDGNYYVDLGARKARVYRYGPDMKPRPFPVSHDPEGEGRLTGYSRNRGVGLTADALGNVYVLWKKGGTTSQPDDMHKSASLFSYAPDGKLLKEPLVDCQMPNIYSPRVDFAGNIYLVVGLRPGKGLLVPGLAGQVVESPEDPGSVNSVNSYPLIYGSVVKFPPAGGQIRENAGGVECNYGPGKLIAVKGASWIVPGVSVAGSLAAPKRTPGTLITCVCEYPNIDVDDFGRTFFPDAARCRVGVIDTAGNEVCFFGGYGNGDSAGPGSKVPAPDIPMWWPQAVAVNDTAAFVGDRLNRRLLAVRLDYAATAECRLP